MPSALTVVNLAISKETVRLEDSKLKIAGALTLEKMVFVDNNKQFLAAMEHKGFQGIVADVKRANTGLRIVGPRETHEVTSCHWETTLLPNS